MLILKKLPGMKVFLRSLNLLSRLQKWKDFMRQDIESCHLILRLILFLRKKKARNGTAETAVMFLKAPRRQKNVLPANTRRHTMRCWRRIIRFLFSDNGRVYEKT